MNQKIKYKINSSPLSHIPWEQKPPNCNNVMWRSKVNPVIPKDLLPSSNSIFNSAIVPFNNKFAGVFRCDNKSRYMRIHSGQSENGIDWKIDPNPIEFFDYKTKQPTSNEYTYDPRVCFIDDRYYISWCNAINGQPTIGLGYTFDFKEFFQMENAFLPFNRNGVLFPRKINGNFAMLSRPSDNGHTPFGDIYYSSSPDMIYWGKHRHVMGTLKEGWQSTKVGAGPIPIETSEGWLMIYHGVLTSCSGFVYSMGAALLDLDEPWKVIARTEPYILAPQESYERMGDVPNVVFPCAALVDSDTGRLAIYYGAADTVTGVAFAYTDELIDFIKDNSL